MSHPIIVLATGNRKKGAEMSELLRYLGLELKTLADFDDKIEVVEDGGSFAENAAIKGVQQARFLKHWVIAEDSGLSVDALGGAPGIFSARFSGENATDESNNHLLLEKLKDLPLPKRGAYYTSHFVITDPTGMVRARCEGRCYGRIRTVPSGFGGFGYDPLFEIVEYHKTFGELSAELKHQISHRGRSARQLIPMLTRLVDNGEIR